MREPEVEPERVQVSVQEARDTILGWVRPLGTEIVGLREAGSRVLAEQICSSRWVPPLDNSAMDGFALRAQDIATVPAELRVVENLPAGRRSERRIGPGEAARIMTGAAIPDGADAVLMQEHAEFDAERVKALRSVEPGENVRRAGADVRPGTRVADPGTLLGPAHIGMLAAIGRTTVQVALRPRVAILATGEELVEPDRLSDDGRIASSNSYTLQAALLEMGAEPVYLGIAPDDPTLIAERLRQALSCDAVISTGGVSVGEHDWIKDVLAKLGGSLRLWRVQMKPGAPLAFAMVDERPVFGLPGNPVSTLVSFEVFVRPALLRMARHPRVFRPIRSALLAEDYRKSAGSMHFVRVTLERRGEDCFAFPTGDQSSGVLLSMVRAEGLAVIAAEATHVPAGTEVPVQLLGGSELRAEPGF